MFDLEIKFIVYYATVPANDLAVKFNYCLDADWGNRTLGLFEKHLDIINAIQSDYKTGLPDANFLIAGLYSVALGKITYWRPLHDNVATIPGLQPATESKIKRQISKSLLGQSFLKIYGYSK